MRACGDLAAAHGHGCASGDTGAVTVTFAVYPGKASPW